MFDVVFVGDDKYIKYICVVIDSIIKNTNKEKSFKEFFIDSNCIDSTNEGGGGGNSLDFIESKKTKFRNFAGITHKILDYDTLSETQKKEGYIFHILSDGITQETKAKLESLMQDLNKIYPCTLQTHILSNELFSDVPKFKNNYSTYFKLKIPDIIESNMALYLDADMLVMCDIRELFCIDISEYFVGAICDFNITSARDLLPKDSIESKEILTFDSNYFNAGFLLFNIPKCKAANAYTHAINVLKKYNVKYHDQDAFNIIFKNNVLKLSFAYNFLLEDNNAYPPKVCSDEGEICDINYTREQINIAFNKPLIYHYIHAKTWESKFAILWQYKDYYPLSAIAQNRVAIMLWWECALNITQFKSDFLALKNKLEFNDFLDYTHSLSKKLTNRDDELNYQLKKLRKKNKKLMIFLAITFIIALVGLFT